MPIKGGMVNDTEAGLTKFLSPLPEIPQIGLHPPWSTESVLSSVESIEMPHNVESLMNDEKYYLSRKAQETSTPRRSVESFHDSQNTNDPRLPIPSGDGNRAIIENRLASPAPSLDSTTTATEATKSVETPEDCQTTGSSCPPNESSNRLTMARCVSNTEVSQTQRLSKTPSPAKSRKRGTVA